MRALVEQSTARLDVFDYASVLHSIEDEFWSFCDNYLELVKLRSYADDDTPGRRSAVATLSWALRAFLRMLAPFVPFVTEEVWSWSFAEDDEKSVHATRWPVVDEVDDRGL